MLGKSTGLPEKKTKNHKNWRFPFKVIQFQNDVPTQNLILWISKRRHRVNQSLSGIAIKYGTQFSGEGVSFKTDQFQ